MKQKLIPIKDQEAWESAISSIPHTYTHTHWYNYAMHIASKRDVFLYAGEADNFQVVCPISLRQKDPAFFFDITTPYGFSGFASQGDYKNFADKWSQYLLSQKYICGHIALHPFFQKNELFKSSELFPGKKTYYLDISNPIDGVYKNFSDGHRYGLRQWQKLGLSVVSKKDGNTINSFLKLYAETLKVKNAASIYDFGEMAWRLILSSSHVFLFSVERNDQIEAAAVFILHNEIVDYFMMASTNQGRIHARGILWEAIKYFHTNGVKWLHLGCGIKENDTLEQFKARFGGKAFTTYALKQIYDFDSYSVLCKKYSVNPDILTGYFPSYWTQILEE